MAWFSNIRTMHGKIAKWRKSRQAEESFIPQQQWTLRSFSFLDTHLSVQLESRELGQVCIISFI